jgi:lambda family phage portal protein
MKPNLNWIDKAVAFVDPQAGLRRAGARLRYEAARTTRFRDPAQTVSGSESTRNGVDWTTLTSLSRDLEQNFAIYRHLLDKFSLFTVPRLTYQSRTGDAKADRMYEAYWQQWCHRCDYSNRHNLTTLARLALRSRKRDGDVLVVFRSTRQGLKLQLVESDRIGNPYEASASETYIRGVTLDPDTGRVLSYRVFRRTRGDAYIDPIEVPADQALLLMNPTRLDQYRGVTDFASLINTARDYKDTMEALRQGIKFEALHSAVVRANSPTADPDAAWAAGNTQMVGNRLEPITNIEPGKVQYLNQDEELQFLTNSRPSTAFQGYMESLIAEMAAGANLPAGFLHGMLTGKGPGVRMEAQIAQRTFALEQSMLVDQFLDPVKDRVILDGILSGQLPATEHWRHGKFAFGPWVTIDAGRDSRAMLDELAAGVRTMSSVADEQGDDWEDVFRQGAIEERRKAEIRIEEGLAPAPVTDPPVKPAQASAQLAVYLADDSFVPPAAAADNARRSLEVRESKPASQRGMTPVGIARARDISNRRPLSESTVREMVAWFERHEVDKQGATWNQQGKGWQAWHGWGGDEARSWAKELVERLDKAERDAAD